MLRIFRFFLPLGLLVRWIMEMLILILTLTCARMQARAQWNAKTEEHETQTKVACWTSLGARWVVATMPMLTRDHCPHLPGLGLLRKVLLFPACCVLCVFCLVVFGVWYSAIIHYGFWDLWLWASRISQLQVAVFYACFVLQGAPECATFFATFEENLR